MNHYSFIFSLLASTARLAAPLILASLGGYCSERSGIINIALEGMALIGAFASAAGAHWFHNPWVGLLCGLMAAIFFSAIHAFLCITLKANHIISGVALGFLATGLSPVICKAFYGFSGGTPQLTANDVLPHFFLGFLPSLNSICCSDPNDTDS